MEWFFVALAAPALWAISNYLEKYIISKYFQDEGTGAMLGFSGLAILFFMPFLAVAYPESLHLGLKIIILLFLSGVLGEMGLVPYFYALKQKDTSLVVPMFQCIPVFSYILGYFFLGEIISRTQLLGMAIIITGGLGLSLSISGEKINFDGKTFWFMILSSFLIALSSILFKYSGIEGEFGLVMVWYLLGALISSLAFVFLIRSFRQKFIDVCRNNTAPVLGFNFLNQLVGMLAEICVNFAVLLAPVALVWSLNSLQPLFVLALGLLLSKYFPYIIRETTRRRYILKKTGLIILMFVGTLLLFIEKI